MKTKNVFLIVLVAISITGYSQMRFGVIAGLNIASLKGTYPSNITNKQKIGFHAGATAEYPLANPKLALAAQLLYSTQGSVTQRSQLSLDNGAYTYIDQETKVNFTEIDLPIMLRYYVLYNLSIEGGPQIGYVVKAEQKDEYTNSANPVRNYTTTLDPLKDGTYTEFGAARPYKKSLETVDFGLNFGAVYDMSDRISLQAHYYFGLNTLQSIPNVSGYYSPSGGTGLYSTSSDYKNSVFQVSLGYKFN